MENNFENVCHFNPTQKDCGHIHFFHFVQETKQQTFKEWRTLSYYRIHFFLEGSGVLHTQNREFPLSQGDIFFTFPSTPYGIETTKKSRFCYIGYLGERALAIAAKFNIDINNCVFHGFDILSDLWKQGTTMPLDILNIYSESLLLSSISLIAQKTLQFETEKQVLEITSLVKKYVDENFSKPDLSLQEVSKALSYNPTYISNLFKKQFKITFKKYLNTVRIQNACALMNKGFVSVQDIAFLCGFNDPLYFSKVFKNNLNTSPSEFIKKYKSSK